MCGAMNGACAIERCVWVAEIVEIARGMKRQIHPTRVVQMCGAMNGARAIEWCVWVAEIVEIARGMKRQIRPTRVGSDVRRHEWRPWECVMRVGE